MELSQFSSSDPPSIDRLSHEEVAWALEQISLGSRPAWKVFLDTAEEHIRSNVDFSDSADVKGGDKVVLHCVNEACFAPLELAAAAFAALASLFARPSDDYTTDAWLTLIDSLFEVDVALRRPGMLRRVDEMLPHAAGIVLSAIAKNMQDHVNGFSTVAMPTVVGALQLVRFGATLAPRPRCSALRIQTCASLALAHVQCFVRGDGLQKAHPRICAQAGEELLHGQDYLQALLQFAAHVQALTEKEHRLLGKSMVPIEPDGTKQVAAQAYDKTVILPVLCHAQVSLLDAAWIIVQRRVKLGIRPVVSTELADNIIRICCRPADFNSAVPALFSYENMGILSDSRPLLMAVAPAASARMKAAAVVTMEAGLKAAVHPCGMVTRKLTDEDMLPWRAVHCMAYMAAMDAVCGATSAAHLLAFNALLPAWQAAASTLQYCAELLNSKQMQSRLAAEKAVQVAPLNRITEPRFPRNVIFDDVSEAIAKAIQLIWKTVKQLVSQDYKWMVGSALSLFPNDVLMGMVAACVHLPLCGFATPKTRFGREEDMLLMRGHWQLADMHLCIARVPMLLKEKGRVMSSEAFHRTMLSGCQFVAFIMDVGLVAECSVPPCAPSMTDTILRGCTELSTISREFAADWPETYMALRVVVVLMDALLVAADLASTPAGKAKVDDVADCCKCLCSALCEVATSVHGPCTTVKSACQLVHGMAARDAVAQLKNVQLSLDQLHAGMSFDLAERLRDNLSSVELAIIFALPPSSSKIAKELAQAASTASCRCCQKPARSPASRDGLSRLAARQAKPPPASPAQPSPEEQQQSAAAAERMAQLLLEEEEAQAAARSAKQARRKARKKAARTASQPVDSPRQPSLAGDVSCQREAAAAGQFVSSVADPAGGAQPEAQPASHPDAAAGPPDASGEVDNSWQLCPLTKARMSDPVIASDGICYERAAIEAWVAEHGTVSPVTKQVITADLIPNHSLRSLLQALQQRP